MRRFFLRLTRRRIGDCFIVKKERVEKSKDIKKPFADFEALFLFYCTFATVNASKKLRFATITHKKTVNIKARLCFSWNCNLQSVFYVYLPFLLGFGVANGWSDFARMTKTKTKSEYSFLRSSFQLSPIGSNFSRILSTTMVAGDDYRAFKLS